MERSGMEGEREERNVEIEGRTERKRKRKETLFKG